MDKTKEWSSETAPRNSSGGRPDNARIRRKFKEHTDTAIENIAKAMKFSSKRVDELMREMAKTQIWLEEAEVAGDQESQEKWEKRLDHILRRIHDASETTVKHSVKLLDYSYKIVIHEETMTVTRTKLNKAKKKEQEDDEEEGNYSYSMPTVSRIPVGNK